jgi:hypothetical protein
MGKSSDEIKNWQTTPSGNIGQPGGAGSPDVSVSPGPMVSSTQEPLASATVDRPVHAGKEHVKLTKSESRSSKEIQDDIDYTRSRMDQTVAAIQDRLSPQQLVGQAVDSVRDVVLFPITDSMDLYQSVKDEQRHLHGAFKAQDAAAMHARYVLGANIEYLKELSYWDKKALHNLKYFTWVEQQGKTSDELNAMWEPDFWTETLGQADEWDKLIRQFNERTGVLAKM